MKKAEALSRLLALIDEVPNSEEVEAVLAVLSVPCPVCEGEKPLVVVEGWASAATSRWKDCCWGPSCIWPKRMFQDDVPVTVTVHERKLNVPPGPEGQGC